MRRVPGAGRASMDVGNEKEVVPPKSLLYICGSVLFKTVETFFTIGGFEMKKGVVFFLLAMFLFFGPIPYQCARGQIEGS
jgi:hypothetical protein